MKKYLLYCLLMLIALWMPITSYAWFGEELYSPSINYYNRSPDDIIHIKGTWAGISLHETNDYPGQEKSQVFPLKRAKDFYGPVHLTWENAAGKQFTKDFTFTEEDLPVKDIEEAPAKIKKKVHTKREPGEKRYISPQVIFEFTQDGVEYYTTHASDYEERRLNSGRIGSKMRSDYLDKHPLDEGKKCIDSYRKAHPDDELWWLHRGNRCE